MANIHFIHAMKIVIINTRIHPVFPERTQLPYAASVARELDLFLKHDTQKTLLLKGLWGVGKTYFWNAYILERLRPDGPVRESMYAHVSLFGLNSIEEVEQLILAQTTPINSKSGFARNRNKLRKLLPWIETIPRLKEFAGPIRRIGTLLLKNTLICFDDLERLGSGLSLSEIFGFIAMLREHNNCRVVVLANDDAIVEQNLDVFNLYHEKIFDRIIPFSPPPAECAEIVFNGCADLNILTRILVRLPLSNIRIIRLASWLMDDISPLLAGRLPETIQLVRNHLLMLTAFTRDKTFHIDVSKVAT